MIDKIYNVEYSEIDIFDDINLKFIVNNFVCHAFHILDVAEFIVVDVSIIIDNREFRIINRFDIYDSCVDCIYDEINVVIKEYYDELKSMEDSIESLIFRYSVHN